MGFNSAFKGLSERRNSKRAQNLGVPSTVTSDMLRSCVGTWPVIIDVGMSGKSCRVLQHERSQSCGFIKHVLP